ncbi:hypothetical protein BH11MYX4_BH11MYX4_55610 [soil metagenome]
MNACGTGCIRPHTIIEETTVPMNGSSANTGSPADGTTSTEQAPEQPSAARRPYHAPKLRHLGSVRELTLGATSGMIEGGGTFMPGM